MKNLIFITKISKRKEWKMKKSKGWNFTLIELLIVVAIIAILAGMLLPALRAALRQGKIISCIGNQKQISFGLSNYASDNKEWFPRRGISATMLHGNTWHRALLGGGYISRPMGAEKINNKERGKTVLVCPEDISPNYWSVSPNDALSYSVNGMIINETPSDYNAHYMPRSILAKGRRCNNPYHTKTIKKSPSEITLTADGFNSLGLFTFQPWASNNNSHWDTTMPKCVISPRHTTGAVFSFVDGHTGFFKFPFQHQCLNPEEKLSF